MSGAKHIRLRYYTSLEEAMLVRLWRQHLHEISSYTDNLPIFREIADGLQKHGIRLNKQEVRRRLNNYRNKYLSERSRIDGNPEYKSEWRLYAMVHTLFQPARPVEDIDLAHTVLEAAASRARADLPALPAMILTTASQLKFERDPDGCAFLDAGTYVPPPVKIEPSNEPYNLVKTEPQPTDAELSGAVALYSYPTAAEDAIRRAPLTPANHQLPEPSLSANVNGQQEAERALAKKRRGRRSIMPRNGQITMAHVEQLRKENQMLQEQNDAHLLALEQKEKHFLAMEQTFLAYLDRQEHMLAEIMRLGIKNEPDPGY